MMAYGNTAVILMVIAVVCGVLGLTWLGMHCLNKSVDQSES